MRDIVLSPKHTYTIEDIFLVATNKAKVSLSPQTIRIIEQSYKRTTKIQSGDAVYGLTSGLADLTSEKVSADNGLAQEHILLSHSSGVGDYLEKDLVRAIIFSRLITLSQGHSGVRVELLKFLTELLNKDAVPMVSSLGSIGAGDLTVLSETFLPILNKGKILYKDQLWPPHEAFAKAKISYPKQLVSREGLALICGNNGTVGITSLLLMEFESFIKKSVLLAAMSMEGRGSTYAAYNPTNQLLKPFVGQAVIAKFLENLLQGSEQITTTYTNTKRDFLQDPPSFKTIVQNIGNAWDILQNTKLICTTEINGVTDNPLLTNKTVQPTSSGNYYCAQLASALDQLAMVISQISSSSAARIGILTNDKFNEGLPKYLINHGGVNSGFMIPVYVAQAVVNEIRALCYPRSTFSSTVANGWEDVATNAYNSALYVKKILALANELMAIELLIATQAIALRRQENKTLRLGNGTGLVFNSVQSYLSSRDHTLPFEKDFYIGEVIRLLKQLHSEENFLARIIQYFPEMDTRDSKEAYNENKRRVTRLYKKYRG